MTRLTEEDTNLLLAITSAEFRFRTYLNWKRMEFGRQLSKGSTVFVEVKGISKFLPGIVRYKGELPPGLGTWFGVELIKNPGSGTCDGRFRSKRYFTCRPNSGVFVGLDKLSPREDKDDKKPSKTTKKDENNLESPLKASILSFCKVKHELRSFQGIDVVLKPDERVVTFINNSPARGTVRYIAEEKDSTGNSFIIVGLELVDVYSFGVLLCEMCIRELPDPERRDEQVARVMNGVLRGLIRGCLQTELETRPSMEDVISQLEQPI